MIVVRPAMVSDAEAMSDVLVASITALCIADHQNMPDTMSRWLANKSPAGVRQWFANPQNRLFVAERDGALAAAGGINTARQVILNYVSPEHRFAGVSTALLAAMEKSGFREYFNPQTGEGLGAVDFTWGSLIIDMLEPYSAQ